MLAGVSGPHGPFWIVQILVRQLGKTKKHLAPHLSVFLSITAPRIKPRIPDDHNQLLRLSPRLPESRTEMGDFFFNVMVPFME